MKSHGGVVDLVCGNNTTLWLFCIVLGFGNTISEQKQRIIKGGEKCRAIEQVGAELLENNNTSFIV